MSAIQFTKKQQFVDALEARRKEFAAHDKKLTADHRKAEQQWLTEFRRLCREAAKRDYEKAAEGGSDVAGQPGTDHPLLTPVNTEPETEHDMSQIEQPQIKVGGMRGARTSATYDALVEYLETYEPDEDGNWPAVEMWAYDHASAADTMGWRVRNGKIPLPDEHGGDDGRWGAKVERVVRGKEGRMGKCRMWVWYLGTWGEVEGG
jgi:hypothetical protein